MKFERAFERDVADQYYRNLWTPLIDADGGYTSFCYQILKLVMTQAFEVSLAHKATKGCYTTLCQRVGETAVHIINSARLRSTDETAYRNMAIEMSKARLGYLRRRVLTKYLRNKLQDGAFVLDRDQLMHVGNLLIRTLISSTGLLYESMVQQSKTKVVKLIKVHPGVTAWLEQQQHRLEIFAATMYPRVQPSREWTDWNKGGYDTDVPAPLTKFIRAQDAFSRLAYYQTSQPARDVANILGSTGWRVSRRVLDTFWQLKDIPNLPTTVAPPSTAHLMLPMVPWGSPEESALHKKMFPEEHRKLKRAVSLEYDRIYGAAVVSKRISMLIKAQQANEMARDSALYFPHSCDFRGRYYPMTTWLSPQSDDFGKSLLEFSEGTPIDAHPEGYYWLCIHGANTAGIDKVSFDERISWVKDNHNDILETALNPMDMVGYWGNMDSPWQFLAFCFAYSDVYTHGKDAKVHLSVSFDGSCNGLQHFSAMLLDPIGGKEVNLIPGNKPSDLYSVVARKAQALLQTYEPRNEVEAEAQKFWLAQPDGITRKLAKRGTMTTPYGVTQFGMREQLISDFMTVYGRDITKHAALVTKLIKMGIDDTVKAASVAMGFLRSLASEAVNEGLPLTWRTPLGFYVYQDYKKRHRRKLIQADTTVATIADDTPRDDDDIDTNTSKNVSAMSPNFVHSMDASHLGLTVLELSRRGVKDFAMIHDSYGTNVTHASLLRDVLREEFVKMYSGHDWLHALLLSFRERGLKAPSITAAPERGDLDLSGVLASEYFFA